MRKSKRFISLKWKFAFGLGVFLISLFSTYSYYVYREAAENFARSRSVAQENQINIARALTQDSFFVLERFVESILMVHEKSEHKIQPLIQLFNQHWSQWQVIWGLENMVFYDRHGRAYKQWGGNVKASLEAVQRVLYQEQPEHQIICDQGCFQQVLTPVLVRSEVIGVLSTSLSLSDTLLTYQNAIHSDIGVIVEDHETVFSAVTHADKNNLLWKKVRATYELKTFTQSALVFNSGQERFELRAFPISGQQLKAPYYVIINNITKPYQHLQSKLYELSIAGLVGLLSVIFVLLVNIHFALARVSQLSKSLPLLVEHQYQSFRNKIKTQRKRFFSDEVERLTQTATVFAQDLEVLEHDVKNNTNLLIKKTQELEQERDFVAQLIDTAPIIILTQDTHGIVLSVNQEGLRNMGISANDIVGKQFSQLIPASETEHLEKLNVLRQHKKHQEISYSGQLNLQTEETVFIDWIHTIIGPHQDTEDRVVLSLGVDVTERNIADDQLLWCATHDQLTGLSNRRHFQTELDNMLAVAERYEEQLALFYLDLDQFKVINDTHGHQAGDKLLQLITDILRKAVRKTDLLSRIGGDEFTLVIPSANNTGVEDLAKKLLQELKKVNYTINEQPHTISFSIGVAIYPQHGKTEQELLANADLAMYYAKKTGRARYHIYSPDFEYQAVLTEQLHWKHIIESAIDKGQFILFYQPILDIKHKQVSHFECLLRIEKTDGSILMPGDFISQAEQLGLIGKIDHIVLEKAIEQHLAFQAIGNDARLAINLSGRSMNDMEILPHIEQLLSMPGVKPDLIIFEITETSAVSNFLSAKKLIIKLRALGCRFALDDFGVGFSSFYYLKSLPVDYVKIDGSFVKQMDINEEDRIFVKVLTEVSQAFGKKIVAEFVENETILKLLEQQSVDYAQGHYISKPLRDPLDLSHVKGLRSQPCLTADILKET